MECGLAIQPQRLAALRDGVACPRCRGALRVREFGEHSAIECASCAGLWLAPELFEAFCSRAEHEGLAESALDGPPGAAVAVPPSSLAYIPCLTCGELMLRKNFGGSSGVLIDLCKHHGVWLDHRELERVLAFVRRGGLVRAREREVARLDREAERRKAAASTPVLDAPVRGLGSDPWERETDVVDALAWLGRTVLRWMR